MARPATDVVGVVEDAYLAAAAASVRQFGFVPPPQIHMLIDHWDQPYVGYVATRPYRRGFDAAEAIIGLGDAPAAIMATRLVVVWEAADLSVSLNGPGEYPAGVAVLVASLAGGHVLRWHPAQLYVSDPGECGQPIVEPEWGWPSWITNAALPPVIDGVLARWRSFDGDPNTVFAELVANGYSVRLAQR